MSERIVILGAGPTGLGAAYRLQELGYESWDCYEQHDYVGGLATSFIDDLGFTYDIGGHVMFSHYAYYDALVERLLGDAYTEIDRESWIWTRNRFVPYPFQNNIRYLEPEDTLECLQGLITAQRERSVTNNFEDWIAATFGNGIARQFMLPYNQKVWAHPIRDMSQEWIAERVSVVDVDRALANVILQRDDLSWGPNNRFKYPLRGGTGQLFNAFRPYVQNHLHLNKRAHRINVRERRVDFSDGTWTSYDTLISTLPLDQLVTWAEGIPPHVRSAATALKHSGCYVVGVGVSRSANTSKCWMYFPEPDVPFYRVTYLSNYSPHMTPDDTHHLLLTETSYSDHKPESPTDIVDRVIRGLLSTGLLEPEDRARIAATHLIDVPYAYPIPRLERDDALACIQPFLMEHGVYSRGRFGAWLYEIGNMDHSVMQGVETVDQLILGTKETTWRPSPSSGRILALRSA